MNWLAIALIIFIALWVRERGQNRHLRRENRALLEQLGGTQALTAQHTDNQDAMEAAELADLRERVQVRERIATDENSSEARKAQRIAREIESLRSDIAQRSSSSKEDVSE